MPKFHRSTPCHAKTARVVAAVLVGSFAILFSAPQPNILILSVDDMNCDSIGEFGCPVPGTTPHIDSLAKEGMRFSHAHVNIAVCQPCRGVVMTGRYPHRSGIEGFQHLPDDSPIPTLMEAMRDGGFLTAIFGKIPHFTPKESFPWDEQRSMSELGQGRDPARYARSTAEVIQRSATEGKPFFLVANAHDPHRPFAGSDQEKKKFKEQQITPPSKTFRPSEVIIPGFLPDLPDVRREIAEYYSSVRRADDVVGGILEEIAKAGLKDNTIVLFFSDHGMPLPFAKTNCYLHSTRTPLIVRWPGRVTAGVTDDRHLVSTIDFMPTLLQACGLPRPDGMDGRSFLPILKGGSQEGRDFAFTQFHETSAKKRFPMRGIISREYAYIWNPWSDGDRVFKNESQSGRTFQAMDKAAAQDSAIAERVELFTRRTGEEFFNLGDDPDALKNRVADPGLADLVAQYRHRLSEWMVETGDPAAEAFRNIGSEEARRSFMKKQDAAAEARKKAKKAKKKRPARPDPA